jgi:transposase-like protein
VACVVGQHKSIASVACELGVGESTWGSWVSAARDAGGGGVTREEREEIRMLEAADCELSFSLPAGRVPDLP